MALSLFGKSQYDKNTPFYSGYDATGLINQYQQGPRRSTMDAELDPYGHIGTNWRGMDNSAGTLRDGHMMLAPGEGGTYRLTDGRQVGPETPWDYFDASGQYQGSNTRDSGKSGIHAMMPSVVKGLTMAMIGGGLLGGLAGVGPMASPGGFFNPGVGAGGTGAGAAGAGGGWMSGVDGAAISGGGGAGASAPIFSSGGAASGFAGAGGAAGAGGSGGGFMDLIKTGASKVFGGGGSGGGGGGSSNLLGLGATALGALSGGQGQDASASSTRAMDPRMDALFYGDIAPRTQGLLGGQMSAAQGAGSQLLSRGQELLGQTAPTTPTSPYLQGRADDIQRRTAELLGQNNLAIRGNAVASGGLGGSRQGVAEGIAAGRAADYLQGNLASFYGDAYNQDQGRLRQDWTIGSGLASQGLNTPFQPLQNAASIYSPFTGTGTTTTSQQSGGGWRGSLGGALAGLSFGKQMGWWG